MSNEGNDLVGPPAEESPLNDWCQVANYTNVHERLYSNPSDHRLFPYIILCLFVAFDVIQSGYLGSR